MAIFKTGLKNAGKNFAHAGKVYQADEFGLITVEAPDDITAFGGLYDQHDPANPDDTDEVAWARRQKAQRAPETSPALTRLEVPQGAGPESQASKTPKVAKGQPVPPRSGEPAAAEATTGAPPAAAVPGEKGPNEGKPWLRGAAGRVFGN